MCIKLKLSIALCSFLDIIPVMRRYKNAMGNPHRNFVYIIEKKVNGKWKLEWDFGCYLTYDVADQVMHDFERYNKNPEDFRIVMYVSEKPHDE